MFALIVNKLVYNNPPMQAMFNIQQPIKVL